MVMGFDLSNDRGSYLRFSPSGWALGLNLAQAYGWTPQGTTHPAAEEAGEEWSGEYATNEGQRVSSADAASLADACESALADPNYVDRASHMLTQVEQAIAGEAAGYQPNPVNRNDMIKFRERIGGLITFCREGAFTIE
jgi:hypothetical protein